MPCSVGELVGTRAEIMNTTALTYLVISSLACSFEPHANRELIAPILASQPIHDDLRFAIKKCCTTGVFGAALPFAVEASWSCVLGVAVEGVVDLKLVRVEAKFWSGARARVRANSGRG